MRYTMKPVNLVTKMTDIPEDRDGFRFRGGCSAIDLPATLQGRLTSSPRELLNTPMDLVRWLTSSGLAREVAKTTDKDLLLARTLREAIYSIAKSLHDGSMSRKARTELNKIAAGTDAVPQLQDYGVAILRGEASALLATLARQAVYLFGSDAVKSIRQCQSPTCTLFFIDKSHRGDRRWCSMAACGNRAKLAKFRGRHHASS